MVFQPWFEKNVNVILHLYDGLTLVCIHCIVNKEFKLEQYKKLSEKPHVFTIRKDYLLWLDNPQIIGSFCLHRFCIYCQSDWLDKKYFHWLSAVCHLVTNQFQFASLRAGFKLSSSSKREFFDNSTIC